MDVFPTGYVGNLAASVKINSPLLWKEMKCPLSNKKGCEDFRSLW
jgi:hypothetical protein